MEGRKRTVQVKFYVTEEERRLIREKMKLIPTRNMAAYLRKMAIDQRCLPSAVPTYQLILPELHHTIYYCRCAAAQHSSHASDIPALCRTVGVSM